MTTYLVGKQIEGAEINNVDDWVAISNPSPETPGSNGIFSSDDWHFSQSKLMFRQIGSNTNGQEWKRYYRAVVANSTNDSATPAHVIA